MANRTNCTNCNLLYLRLDSGDICWGVVEFVHLCDMADNYDKVRAPTVFFHLVAELQSCLRTCGIDAVFLMLFDERGWPLAV